MIGALLFYNNIAFYIYELQLYILCSTLTFSVAQKHIDNRPFHRQVCLVPSGNLKQVSGQELTSSVTFCIFLTVLKTTKKNPLPTQ